MGKKIIYVVTIEEIADYRIYPHTPVAFSKKEDARKYLKDTYDKVDAEFNSDLIREFEEDFANIYDDNCFICDHWTISIDEVELDAAL